MKQLLMLAEALLGADWKKRSVPGQILAVDDDPGNLDVLVGLLEDEYSIQATTSPVAALELLEKYDFDMVIADQRMPEMTGVQLLNAARTKCPETVRIIISAYSDSKELLQCINEGQVFRYLLKPWVPEEVESVIRQGLEHRMQRLTIRKLVDALHNRNTELQSTMAELKEAQESLVHSARLATVGQLTTSIAHELRNQLTVVRAVYEMVKSDLLTDELKEMVAVGDMAINNLLNMLSTVSAFSKAGKWSVDSQECDLTQVLNDAITMSRMDERAKRRRLTLKHPDEPCLAFVDPIRIGQVIVNLVRNALEATSEGGDVKVELSATESHWSVAVADNGVGVPGEDLGRLFDMFFTTKEHGVGLGLSISKQILDAHNGSIDVQSSPGLGTTFQVLLPRNN